MTEKFKHPCTNSITSILQSEHRAKTKICSPDEFIGWWIKFIEQITSSGHNIIACGNWEGCTTYKSRQVWKKKGNLAANSQLNLLQIHQTNIDTIETTSSPAPQCCQLVFGCTEPTLRTRTQMHSNWPTDDKTQRVYNAIKNAWEKAIFLVAK